MASIGVGTGDPRYGVALGNTAAHEFGHYAGGLPDARSGVMGRFNPLSFANGVRVNFTRDEVPRVQSICRNPRQSSPSGGTGRAMPSSGGMFSMFIFDYLYLINRMINESSMQIVGIPADSPLREDVTVTIGPAVPVCPPGMPGCD